MKFISPLRSCLALAGLVIASSAVAQTPTFSTLIDFNGNAAPKGSTPRGRLIFGKDGLIYGTTESGGATGNFGTIYSVATDGTGFTSVEFAAATAGSKPPAGLLLGSDEKFYGVTNAGGTGTSPLGTVFQFSAGTASTMMTFLSATQSDTGSSPTDHLVEGKDGFLYGTTSAGGLPGKGVIFKIARTVPATPTTLVEFKDDVPNKLRLGQKPSSLVLAKDGNFYGTTELGGLYGFGTVFKATTTGVLTTLTSFGSSSTKVTDFPRSPRAPLVQGNDGAFYGTTAEGGPQTIGTASANHGTVFRITSTGAMSVIVKFTGTTGSYLGRQPETALIQGTDGWFYGTTRRGGASDRGTVFRFKYDTTTAVTTFKTLIEFTSGGTTRGNDPRGTLLQDNDGNFYGTTSASGANGAGILFKFTDVLPPKAVVTSTIADNISGTKATLRGLSTNPSGSTGRAGITGSYWFEYGTTVPANVTDSYANVTPKTSLAVTNTAKALSTSVTGLAPATTYHYRLIVQNGGGITYGPDDTFTTGPHPVILDQPDDLLVGVGEPATFSVVSSGTSTGTTVTYAWLKNGTTITGATQSGYSITKAALTSAGTYTTKVTKSPDSVISQPARLGVISKANSIVNKLQGQDIVLALQNNAPTGSLSFQWKKDGTPLADSTHILGATTATLIIKTSTDADNGVYTCDVALGGTTAPSPTNATSGTYTVSVLMRPVMNAVTLGPWTTNGAAFGQITAQHTTAKTIFRSSTLPPGWVLNPTTGVLSGRPVNDGTYAGVKFTATNEAGACDTPLIVTIVVLAPSTNAFGTYHGNLTRDAGTNANLGGGFTMTMTNVGTGTGTLTFQGRSLAFTSKLSPAPNSTRDVICTPGTGITGFPSVVASLDESTGNITGTIAGTAFTAKRKTAAGTHAGKYNVAFNVPAADATNSDRPQGTSYGTLTIGTDGTATWALILGDVNVTSTTTSLTQTSSLASDGTISLHRSLYTTGTGSIQGIVSLDASHILTEQSLDWYKAAQPGTSTTRSYKTGFPLHTLEADGAKYTAPTAGMNVLGLTGTTDNAQLVFTLGGLTSTITQIVSIPSTNLATVNATNLNSVTLKLDTVNGKFSGTFTIPDALPANVRKVSFTGILLPYVSQGFGQFQLPELPSPTTSKLVSGHVLLKANP